MLYNGISVIINNLIFDNETYIKCMMRYFNKVGVIIGATVVNPDNQNIFSVRFIYNIGIHNFYEKEIEKIGVDNRFNYGLCPDCNILTKGAFTYYCPKCLR